MTEFRRFCIGGLVTGLFVYWVGHPSDYQAAFDALVLGIVIGGITTVALFGKWEGQQ